MLVLLLYTFLVFFNWIYFKYQRKHHYICYLTIWSVSSLNSIIELYKIIKLKRKYSWPILYLKLCCRTGKGSRSSSLSANWLNRSRTIPTSSPSNLGCPSGLVFLVWCPSVLIPSCETFVLCCTGIGSNPPASRPRHYSRNIHVKKVVDVILKITACSTQKGILET